MYRTAPHNLLYTLESLLQGELIGVVRVPPETSHWANLALERMLSVK
jgi:quinolinate synthase